MILTPGSYARAAALFSLPTSILGPVSCYGKITLERVVFYWPLSHRGELGA